jgi:hypothetical protein
MNESNSNAFYHSSLGVRTYDWFSDLADQDGVVSGDLDFRSVLLLEAGPDYRSLEETPNDLLHSSISFGGHDWGWTA